MTPSYKYKVYISARHKNEELKLLSVSIFVTINSPNGVFLCHDTDIMLGRFLLANALPSFYLSLIGCFKVTRTSEEIV